MASRAAVPADIYGGRMGPIQVIPPGLMGLLQLKQTGKLPGILSDVVSGVIELRDWYMTARRVDTLVLFPGASNPIINGITAPANVGFVPAAGGTATVPENQYWYVEEMTVSHNLTAAASVLRGQCALICYSADVQVVGPDVSFGGGAAIQKFTARNDRPFWAFPGDSFGMVIGAVTTGTAEALTLFLRATVLPA